MFSSDPLKAKSYTRLLCLFLINLAVITTALTVSDITSLSIRSVTISEFLVTVIEVPARFELATSIPQDSTLPPSQGTYITQLS